MLRVSAKPERAVRPRRLRRTPALREAVRETRLDPRDFIYPIFVRPGRGVRGQPGDNLAAAPENRPIDGWREISLLVD